MSHFLLWYIAIQFILMYIIYFNFHYFHQHRYTHYTLFLCLQMELQDQEDKNNQCNQQKIPPNNPRHGSSSSSDNSANKEWWQFWISMQTIVFFEIFFLWKRDILFNIMDIVSQWKDKGLPITIPLCMTKSLLLIYKKIHFNLFCCVI